jgi:hypothetical protein
LTERPVVFFMAFGFPGSVRKRCRSGRVMPGEQELTIQFFPMIDKSWLGLNGAGVHRAG